MDFRHFRWRADCQHDLLAGKINLVSRHSGKEQPLTAHLRRLEGHPVNTFDKQICNRRAVIRQLHDEPPLHRGQLIDAYRWPAGTISIFVTAPRHHGSILGQRLSMGAWQRLAVGEQEFQRRCQRHTDIGTGKRLEFCRDLHGRSGNMAAYIKRQDHRILIPEIIKPEGIEPLWHRPGKPAFKPGRRALRQVSNRCQTCLTRCTPIDFPPW